jgi:hypothetical protein
LPLQNQDMKRTRSRAHRNQVEVPTISRIIVRADIRIDIIAVKNGPHTGQDPNGPHTEQDPNGPHTGQDLNGPNTGQDLNGPHTGQDLNGPNTGQDPNAGIGTIINITSHAGIRHDVMTQGEMIIAIMTEGRLSGTINTADQVG